MTAPITTAPPSAATHRRATVRPDKADTVAELAESFRTASAAVLTEYRGLTVKQVTDLRVALGADTTYSVVKNTLTRLAATAAGLPELHALLTGPTAVAFIDGEPVEAAKKLRDYARANPALVVKGGVLDGKTLSAAEVSRLADLESREVLLAKMAGALLASLSQAVYLFAAPLAQTARLVGALQAKAEQDPSVIGGAGQPAVADPATDPAAPAEVADPASAEPVVDPAATDSTDQALSAEPNDQVASAEPTDQAASAEPAEVSATGTGSGADGVSGAAEHPADQPAPAGVLPTEDE